MISLYNKLTPLQDLQGPSDSHDPTHCLMSAPPPPQRTPLFPNDLTLISHAKTKPASLLGSQLPKEHHRDIRACVIACMRACIRYGRET